MLNTGDRAPDFTLSDDGGRQYSLSDFAGKTLVLYFYPKDNTPGCTRQACAFGALYGQFKTLGAEVVGVSKDSAASHAKFRQKYSLPFIMLSDPEKSVHAAYGAMGEKKALRQGDGGHHTHHLRYKGWRHRVCKGGRFARQEPRRGAGVFKDALIFSA